MAFYLSQPSGSISLQKLTHYAHTRLSFLIEVFEKRANRVDLFDVVKDVETVEDSDCLIEGTCKDRISHAILRLACCGDEDMSNFFVTAEALLFDFRFSCMTKDELYKMFKSVDRYIKRNSLSDSSVISSALIILNTIYEQCASWRKVVQRYLNGDGYFLLPFQNVAQLVGKREVVLDHGVAYVPFYRLREVCTDVFCQLLSDGVKMAKLKFSTDDERIINLTKSIKIVFYCKFRRGFLELRAPFCILHTQVDHLVSKFPPCMAYIHRQLRRKHRLAHHARIQYTLFLKEVGLPVHEAILFWKEEYSKGGHQEARCHHDWSANERRYIYSIRHLYGLEGSRINYRGHSCTAIQHNYYGPQDESGCPFSHFDEDHLSKLLCEEDLNHVSEEIRSLASRKLFSEACHKVFISKIEKEHKCHGHTNLDMKHSQQTLTRSDSHHIKNNSSLIKTCSISCSVCCKKCDIEDLSLDNDCESSCQLSVGNTVHEHSSIETECNRTGVEECDSKCTLQKIGETNDQNGNIYVKKEYLTSVSNMEIDGNVCDDSRDASQSAYDVTMMETGYSHCDQTLVAAGIDCAQVHYDTNITGSLTNAQCNEAVSAFEIQRHLQPYCTEPEIPDNKEDIHNTEVEDKAENEHTRNCCKYPNDCCKICGTGKTLTFSAPVNYFLSYAKLLKHLKDI